MKATDLMIGDWVLYGQRFAIIKELYNGNVTILCSINGQNEYVDETYDNIDPIPLTKEILEKNGFVEEQTYTGPQSLLYSGLADTDNLWVEVSNDGYFEGELAYVHELQHALKLCGIKKEIEL